MAQIKRNFLKSKMNKDLDARLIPNGEYREARKNADVISDSSIFFNKNESLEGHLFLNSQNLKFFVSLSWKFQVLLLF